MVNKNVQLDILMGGGQLDKIGRAYINIQLNAQIDAGQLIKMQKANTNK